METSQWERRKKLIDNLHAVDWPVPADIEVGEEPTYVFAADEDEVRRHRRLKGLIGNVADLVASRGIRTMYPVYRYLSSYAHASLQTGEAFVERGPGVAPALYHTGKVPVGESRAWIPVCLYVAGTAMGQFLVNEPMRKTLEKAAYDLGIGEIVAERIRLELDSR
ncbi:hypothetical protein [Streptomyces sp. NPDC005125]